MNNRGTYSIYLLGIGGIGMSALARYYHNQGFEVSGYDRTPSPLTKQLEDEGMAIHYEDNPDLLPALIDKVIYTPAIKELKEKDEIERRGIPMEKRSVALGEISKNHYAIGVAGTHGKTTTTAMVAHILKECGIDMTAFIGGIAKNFNSNFVQGSPKSTMVVEADEYDRSFLQLAPNISIINAIDADHLDSYGDRQHLVESFNEFARLTERVVIVKEGLNVSAKNILRFGFGAANDYKAKIRKSEEGITNFTISAEGITTQVTLQMPGNHNVMNATAAFAAARQIGLQPEEIASALAKFQGVKRRFDVQVRTKNYTYIDDYAHHPEEIKSCLSAIRASFPCRQITLIFQPHLFTRTRDFMEEFAVSLAMADNLILLDIYPAREKPIEGITSQALLDKVNMTNKSLCPKEQLLDVIAARKPELLVTMGAGDIDRFVEPLKAMISLW